jgi:hypothetical protein
MKGACKFWSGNLTGRNQLEDRNDIKMDLVEALWDDVIWTLLSLK